jgi:hypothetical protein
VQLVDHFDLYPMEGPRRKAPRWLLHWTERYAFGLRDGTKGREMKTLFLTFTRTTIAIALLLALMLFGTIIGARAQRCPAGNDAFGSCLPLDHRYGGPGSIQQLSPNRPRPQDFKCKPWHPPETCAVVRSIGETHRRWGKAR